MRAEEKWKQTSLLSRHWKLTICFLESIFRAYLLFFLNAQNYDKNAQKLIRKAQNQDFKKILKLLPCYLLFPL